MLDQKFIATADINSEFFFENYKTKVSWSYEQNKTLVGRMLENITVELKDLNAVLDQIIACESEMLRSTLFSTLNLHYGHNPLHTQLCVKRNTTTDINLEKKCTLGRLHSNYWNRLFSMLGMYKLIPSDTFDRKFCDYTNPTNYAECIEFNPNNISAFFEDLRLWISPIEIRADLGNLITQYNIELYKLKNGKVKVTCQHSEIFIQEQFKALMFKLFVLTNSIFDEKYKWVMTSNNYLHYFEIPKSFTKAPNGHKFVFTMSKHASIKFSNYFDLTKKLINAF